MAKIKSTYLLLIIYFVLNNVQIKANTESDNIPGVSYEFKIHVDAGKENCFYQYVEPSANLFVAFQVSQPDRLRIDVNSQFL